VFGWCVFGRESLHLGRCFDTAVSAFRLVSYWSPLLSRKKSTAGSGTSAMSISSLIILVATILVGLSAVVEAFVVTSRSSSSISFSSTRLHSKNCVDDDGRRSFMSRSAGAAISVLVGGIGLDQPAFASYTGYTQREKDWQERAANGGEEHV